MMCQMTDPVCGGILSALQLTVSARVLLCSMGRRLKISAAVWGGISVAALLVRALRRRSLRKREARVAAAGGRLPAAKNVVDALRLRGTTEPGASRVALGDASGKTYTWREYHETATRFASALRALAPSGGVAVHAFNTPEWFFSAIGAMAAGWTVSGICESLWSGRFGLVRVAATTARLDVAA